MNISSKMVLEISLTKKCYGITDGRTAGSTDGMTDSCKPIYHPLFQSVGIILKMRRLVHNPTIQYININLHTKYDYQYSSLHSFSEIFDENFHYLKYGKKENWTNTGKNKTENAGSQSYDTIHHYQPANKI